MDTMNTDDLRVDIDPVGQSQFQNSSYLGESVDTLRQENNRLSAENYLLRKHINLVQENSSLRVANILAKILSWFDNEEDNGGVINRQTLEHTITRAATETQDSYEKLREENSPKRYEIPKSTLRNEESLAGEIQTASGKKDRTPVISFQDDNIDNLEVDRAVEAVQDANANIEDEDVYQLIPPIKANSATVSSKLGGVDVVWACHHTAGVPASKRRQSIIAHAANVHSESSLEDDDGGNSDTDESEASIKRHYIEARASQAGTHDGADGQQCAMVGQVDVEKPHGYVWERSATEGNLSSVLGGAPEADDRSSRLDGNNLALPGEPVAASTPGNLRKERISDALSDAEVPRNLQKSDASGFLGDLDDVELPDRDYSFQAPTETTRTRKLAVDTQLAREADIEPALETPVNDESHAAIFNRSPETVVRKVDKTAGKSTDSKKKVTPKAATTTKPKFSLPPFKNIKSRVPNERPRNPTPHSASVRSPSPGKGKTASGSGIKTGKKTRPVSGPLSKLLTPDANNNNQESVAPQVKSSATLQAAALLKLKPTTRLMGEIAFQLDRRILGYVFHKKSEREKRRFYGYIIQNIPDKITTEATDHVTGLVDGEKRYTLEYRYNYILSSLAPFGYTINRHPEFAANMVNSYGLLPVPNVRDESHSIGPECRRVLRELISEICPNHELHDILILLDCLALMAREDGKPMFLH